MIDKTDVSRPGTIANLNDQLRQTGTGGTIVITAALRDVNGFDASILATALAQFDGFSTDNDPHGERDFGSLALFGEQVLFKIDYYNRDLTFGSDDPADPAVTQRVLTVMLARDW